MPDLDASSDPAVLVPGDPAALHEIAWTLGTTADVFGEAADGLARLSTPDGWAGPAADRFRSTFVLQPDRWSDAASAHRTAAQAVEQHALVLERAQQDAAEAAQRWREAGTAAAQQEAQRLLDDARAGVGASGEQAAQTVAAARDRAPAGPDVNPGALSVAAQVGNAGASLVNAALHHPLDDLGLVGGGALAAVSAAGLVGSVALDATGPGAVVGVPLGGLSAAGLVTGVGVAGASGIGLALNAAGPDRVLPFRVANDAAPPPSDVPRTATQDDVARVGEPGRQPNIRQLPDDEAVRALHDRLAENGVPLDRPGYNGSWVTLEDGTEVGFREASKSGGPTIDLRFPDGEVWKIHRR